MHALSLWLRLPDWGALMLFALPVTLYMAWCSETSRGKIIRAALRYYASFAGVLLAAVAIVGFIGPD